MDNINKFEDFLDRMQRLLDEAKKQGHIIVRVEDLENAFPELVESEDEKIRNQIIAYIKWGYDEQECAEEEMHRWISWLEKQGEQKPVFEIKTPKESLGIDSDTYNKIVDDCVYGEQKPIEYPLCKTIKDKIDYYITNHFIADKVTKTTVNAIVNAMKEGVRLGREEQNHAWSEEDESIALGIEQLCNCASLLNIAPDKIDKIKTWLRNLKDRVQPQNTWKPNEQEILLLERVISGKLNPKDFQASLQAILEELKKL